MRRLIIIISALLFSITMIFGIGIYIYQHNYTKAFVKQENMVFSKTLLPVFFSENIIFSNIMSDMESYNIQATNSTNLQSEELVPLKYIETLFKTPINWQFDNENQQYDIQIGQRKFQYIIGMNIGREGNRFFPMQGGIHNDFSNSESLAISVDFIKYGLGYDTKTVFSNNGTKQLLVLDKQQFGEEQQHPLGEESVSNWEIDRRYNYLKHLINPIPGSHVSTKASQWPGAPRTYRNGTHEGLDFYSYTSGITVDKNTAIISMDDGIIIRADHKYRELEAQYRNEILDIASKRNITPEYILDMLRGRSVWIQHTNGIIARYIHLNSIDEDIIVGKQVSKGQVIGMAGNSGTNEGVIGNNGGVHLHLDILIYGQLFWEGLTTENIVLLLKDIFNK